VRSGWAVPWSRLLLTCRASLLQSGSPQALGGSSKLHVGCKLIQ
jgi:hypothetical protein